MESNNEFYTVRGYQLLKKNKKMLTSAMEDYLEMIYRNCLEEGYMRISTLSELLNVRPSSSTKMVQRLAAIGLVDYKRYGIIFLTDTGREIGEFLLKRHNIVEKFLSTIGITENLLKETELIEHNVSVNTLQNIYLLNEFFNVNPDIFSKFKDFKEKYDIEGMFER